jgi:hypothetical protein
VLNGRLALHDIEDVEAFVWRIVHRSRLDLDFYDQEDLATYLVETCWELSLRYKPGTGSTSSFAGWAATNLRKRVVDWQRRKYRTRWVFKDRVYERPRPEIISLDGNNPGGDPLGAALGTSGSDPAADRSPDLARLLGTGGGGRARDYETLGLRPPRRAP